ncbi:MAG: methylated-DNA--[protein]-cysteine S-methyltransferase [Bacteroidetes bacterium]|nr:methylated-DNA--[protein]-cysteine S-methyltransferase [Bacteroidota bacterium]MCW5896574.1 methylated-DNA--[protein]-cysteine S-methyltransferase [Bacteroidota bacterium]
MIGGVTSRGVCLFEFFDRGGLERITARMTKRYGVEMREGTSSLLEELESQACEYFDGTRKDFTLPIDQKGTVFEKNVWNELMKIPYGETRSYGELAVHLGKPGAARAVGRANGMNYIPIIIPCHRVIDGDGNLHGYGGGLWRKRWLLELEGAIPKQMFA